MFLSSLLGIWRECHAKGGAQAKEGMSIYNIIEASVSHPIFIVVPSPVPRQPC